MTRRGIRSILGALCILAIGGPGGPRIARPQDRPDAPLEAEGRAEVSRFVGRYCVDCHNGEEKIGGLALDAIASEDWSRNAETWEKVVRRLETRQMPPRDASRPASKVYETILTTLTSGLDRAAAAKPEPGRTGTFRRLNRTEYQDAIRDLLAVDVDSTTLLPPDESSRGFDNVTVGDLSPTLLERYITAARMIGRLALGTPSRSPGGETFRVRADVTQEGHVEGLPIGTRGGAIVSYTFPQDGEYEIQVRLARDRNEQIEGLREPHELEVLLDREPKARFTIEVPKVDVDHQTADAGLVARLRVSAGPHQVGVTFPSRSSSLLETRRQPFQAHYNMHRHPRLSPAVFQVSITGPRDAGGSGDTPSRRRIFAPVAGTTRATTRPAPARSSPP